MHPDRPAHIIILTHEYDEFTTSSYVLGRLASAWRTRGIAVTVARGPQQLVDADLLFLHVDLTVVPEEYLRAAQRYPIVVNGRVADISKRSFSTNLVSRHDAYAGPVIVKTDLNYGGYPEQRIKGRGRILAKAVRAVRQQLPWKWTGHLQPHSYPVYASPADVPQAVWTKHSLVVQQFAPEREGKFYCTRHWMFLGDREMSSRVLSRQPIVKAANVVHREYDIPIPGEVRQLREKLGFDYGKFDFTLVNGVPFVCDINRTPTFNRSNPNPKALANMSYLSDGIDVLLQQAIRLRSRSK